MSVRFWIESKRWLESLTLRRKLGALLVMLFPAIVLTAWVIEDPSPLRGIAAVIGFAVAGILYIWESRKLSEIKQQARPSFTGLWSTATTSGRIQLVVLVAVMIVLVAIAAVVGFNEGVSRS